MKKLKLLLLGLCVAFFPMQANATSSDNTPINVYIFKSSTCPHCADAMEFFNELSADSEYSKYFKLVSYETNGSSSEIKDNIALAEKVAKYFGEEFSGVPLIIIGDQRIEGFGKDMSDDIKKEIKEQYNSSSYTDVIETVKNGKNNSFETVMTVAIVVVLLGGIGYFIYLARKGTNDDIEMEEKELVQIVPEKKETSNVVEKVVEEKKRTSTKNETTPKKTQTKKPSTKKKTTTAKKTSAKTSATKTTKTTTKKKTNK